MSAPITNLRGRRRLRVTAPYLPAVVVPLLLAGVTVPSVTGVGDAREQLDHARERAARAERAREELLRFGDLEAIAEVESAAGALRALIPAPISEVELFNRLRFLGEVLALNLTRAQVGESTDLGLSVRGESVMMREVVMAGTAPLTRIVAILDGLRQQGLPTSVLEAVLTRGAAQSTDFEFVLRLGLFHRVPTQATTAHSAPTTDAPSL
ncbi:MAG: hypothetical protein R3F49_00985 [Planctomycetota bacterium]